LSFELVSLAQHKSCMTLKGVSTNSEWGPPGGWRVASFAPNVLLSRWWDAKWLQPQAAVVFHRKCWEKRVYKLLFWLCIYDVMVTNIWNAPRLIMEPHLWIMHVSRCGLCVRSRQETITHLLIITNLFCFLIIVFVSVYYFWMDCSRMGILSCTRSSDTSSWLSQMLMLLQLLAHALSNNYTLYSPKHQRKCKLNKLWRIKRRQWV